VQKVLGALRAVAMLFGIWGALLLTAYLMDVLPAFPWQWAPEAPPVEARPVIADAPDAGAPTEASPALEAPADAGVARATEAPRPPSAPPPETTPGLARYAACPGEVDGSDEPLEPTLAALSILNEGTQLVVGCGAESHLLALAEGPAPVRVARFVWEPSTQVRGERRGAWAAAGDVNDDGSADLLLGQLSTAGRSAAQGGALYYVPRDARGGFEAAVALAPIAAASIAIAELDARPGMDVVALHQADTYGRRPSEAWVFGGGGAPARTARLDAGSTARVVRAVDLDRDGHLDVVTLGDGDPGGRVYFGDGTGRFPRSQPLVVAGAREAEVGDLDGDGAPDLVLAGDALRLVRARATADELIAEPLDGPPALSSLALADVNDDGRLDLVGLVGGGVGLLEQTGALTFEAKPLADLPLDAGTIRALVVASLGGGGALDLALLVKQPGEEHGHELVLLTDVTDPIVAATAAEVTAIPDAPLTLRVEMR
jgi:hypothetical protein